jgi:hypothetical protein
VGISIGLAANAAESREAGVGQPGVSRFNKKKWQMVGLCDRYKLER